MSTAAASALTPRNTLQQLEWLHELRRTMPPGPTTGGGNWYMPVLATAGIAASVAILGVWADMRIVKNDLIEIKQASAANASDIDKLQDRMIELEVWTKGEIKALRTIANYR